MTAARAISLCILLAGVITPLQKAAAQGCAATLQPHFSTYRTVVTSGNTISQTVRLEGYASISPSPGCQMQNAIHTPKVYNKLGSSGGWYSGAGACASCYVSFSKNVQIVGVPGVFFLTGTDAQEFCSLLGSGFYNGGMRTGKTVQLIGNTCLANPVHPYGGVWSAGASCLKSEEFLVPQGGVCVAAGTNPAGTTKTCYQTSTNGCVSNYCTVDYRTVDSTCLYFIDQAGYTVTTIPAGCE